MKHISIRTAYGAGWAAFMRRPWYLFGVMLAFIGILIFSLGNAVVTALGYILYSGFLAMMLRHFRGQTIEFDDMFVIDNRWISLAFLGILKIGLIIAGLICFVLPGIYFMIKFMFAELLVIDQGMRPLEALRASATLTNGHWWHLFFFVVITIFLSLIGSLFFLIGALLVSLVALLAMIQLYETLTAEPDVPDTTIDTPHLATV